MRSIKQRGTLLIGSVILLTSLWPVSVDAQRGRARRYYSPRPAVFFNGYYGYPFFYGYGWYPYQFFPPYGAYPTRYDHTSAVRLQVTPRQAEVYVDGYLAGTVDDFDGWLQRLHVQPGGHEIVLRLDGHRSVRHRVMLRPGTTHTIKETLVPLAAGETNEPPPVPVDPPEPRERMAPPERGPERGRRGGDPRVGEPRVENREEAAFGALAIRVQPRDAQVFIDGEPWRGAENVERLVVQLSEGTHRVEVRKEGRQTFSTEVRIRRDETTTLNVSLPPQ